jgi:hypothetical protein
MYLIASVYGGPEDPPGSVVQYRAEGRVASDPQIAGLMMKRGGIGSPFWRGDANNDGLRDVADAVVTLEHLYQGKPKAQIGEICPDAADVNDDGEVDISDPISLLGFLFLGGRAPAAPNDEACSTALPDASECVDPTEDNLRACRR